MFEKLINLGYIIHNKRVIGKPEHTSIEAREKDLIQEYALIVMWMYEKYGLWIKVFDVLKDNKKVFIWSLSNDWSKADWNTFSSPTEAYEAAIEYVLNNLI